MSMNANSPYFLLALVKRIYPDLPNLVGQEAWQTLKPQVDAYMTAIEKKDGEVLASIQLIRLFDDHPSARSRIADELKIQATIIQNISHSIEAIAKEMGINDADTINRLVASAYAQFQWDADVSTIPSVQNTLKSIDLGSGGIDGATSIKFKNMSLDWGKFSDLSAGFVITGMGVIDKPNPLLIIAGVLVTFAVVRREMTAEIAEQEASVFWAMIQLTEAGETPMTVSAIIAKTNTEREQYGLEPLKEAQVRHSLTKLAKLKSIEKTGDAFRIIEKYSVKG